ncbi:putative zinc finger (C-x8-C-x5-C-x3-H)-2 [Toxoplasma gondii GT1]|uniref:Putative zinc finger (C-x8-C-x5-C-x3-H)-2 n=8 Tax=Toxoplasma gondii TaxID=5811 RepID=B9PVY8_TOXGV|nr:putative zinc finger (C-x8-C-x5-C-x3-H)-2 [Toxoplasma gondii GT1]ESS31019.1 putative zinc finger (C-x8-C-x5-C-x3-H)-2 [Toxoplasma gondii VEG]KAF4640185.1 putative zinc finger (C-x8-C-x5-C-x3-H)-2 [Toxoplasma gondii]KFG44117.1 putative zinc finger (C-x8-C-x5-C-x3-H)-2 [Toxoplasma gondii FOU]KFH07541.1 putative zinc finger (C-x8-C-x5-C-x3-H)-2 [Toxoplasma gondii VAND]RQX70103.1 putative zinc finger (C-x8-C-x5-C-x3-H)-2 [Toxoplasma gondii CAST]
MPPKKKDAKAERGMQKAAEREKQKIVEDKTFGLKNKNKSKAVQKYIKGVQQQVKGPMKGGEQALVAKKKEEQEMKKRTAQQQALLASLFKGTENVKKIAEDSCTVGTYDPKASKEGQKINLYTDQRQQKMETMDDWDQEKLEQVIKTKHTRGNEQNATEIICKHFLDAVEKRQYGWFWTCPNGGDACRYRHCLPPGYVLKRDQPVQEVDEEEPIEVIVERERAALPAGGTPVTLETFTAWKEKKEQERIAAVEAQRQAEAKKGGNRGLHVLTGRDLFQYDPSLFVDDEGAAGEADYEEDEAAWEAVINQNQETIDRANREAQGGDEDASDGEADSEKREATTGDDSPGPRTIKEDLFLQDDELPDDLDALDE